MPIKNDREYRSFAFDIKKRAEEDPKEYIVEGYASTFDEYTLADYGDEKWNERILPDAFGGTDMSDVVFLLDHTGRVYARTKNGTVKLNIDEHGLYQKTDLSRTTSSRSVYEDIEAGNYSQMSFAFTVQDSHFEERTEDGVRIITRVIERIKKLYDISAVGFPANPNTDIDVATRSAFDGAIEKLQAERLERMRTMQAEARARLALRLKLTEE